MNVVFPAPFTPTTRITVGAAGATLSVGSLLPPRSAASIPSASASLELRLRLDLPALGAPLHFLDQPQRHRNAEVGLQQHLLELLERAGRDAAARQHGDVHQRDVLDALPERPLGDVARFTK